MRSSNSSRAAPERHGQSRGTELLQNRATAAPGPWRTPLRLAPLQCQRLPVLRVLVFSPDKHPLPVLPPPRWQAHPKPLWNGQLSVRQRHLSTTDASNSTCQNMSFSHWTSACSTFRIPSITWQPHQPPAHPFLQESTSSPALPSTGRNELETHRI